MARKRRRAKGSVGRTSVSHLSGPIVTVRLPVPVSMAHLARTEIYSYPYPSIRERLTKVIRKRLARPRGKFKMVRVRVRLPRRLPLVPGSYVSLDRDRLNIHSKRQREAAELRERNRARYEEGKFNRRKARNGQLASRHSTRFGSLAEASRRGFSADGLGDVALGVRALASSLYR